MRKMLKLNIVLMTLFALIAVIKTQAADLSEFTAHVTAVNAENRQITLNARSIQNENFRLAFEAPIRLLSGDMGSIANIRIGNYVTAVVDSNEKVIHALQVVK